MKKLIFLFATIVCAFSSNAQLPFTQTTLISGLNMPIAFAIAPNDGRFFVTLKAGQILVYNSAGTSIGTFYNLADSVITSSERGLLGICLDPQYNTNHYVYAYYNHLWPNTYQAIRVIRFTDVNNVGTNPTVILDIPVSNSIPGNHVGGNVHFSPLDGKLYISIGELANPVNAQVLTNPFGKILRINKDRTIPVDNPFYDDGNPNAGNDDRIWEYGHRNPFDFCFGANDSLYISENGANTQDEMNLGRKGGNFGWQTCEGNLQYGSNNPCNFPGLINPLTVWLAPLNAVTGIVFYSGCMFPEYKNHIIVANNDVGAIWDVVLGNAPAYDTVTYKSLITDLTTSGGLTTLMVGADGSIYAMNGGYTTNGGIFKLSRTITPAITAGGPTSYCTPGQVVLTASPTGFTYQWYRNNAVINGATNNVYSAVATGNYKVMICNNSSNVIYVQRKVTPAATITPADTQHICSPNTILLHANIGTGLLYQWKKNGTALAGATNNNYTAANSGKYKVLVTSSNGCSRISPQVVVYVTACREEELSASNESVIKISPNPSSDAFTIELNTNEVSTIRILDLQGKILYHLNNVSGQIHLGSELPSGIYLMEAINNKGEKTVLKLVKTE